MAYHHSDLEPEERHLLERAYADSALSVLVSTTTLATGVNLPVNRVIIRSLPRECGVALFHQMCGRSGRVGHANSDTNDVIVMTKGDTEYELAKALYTGHLPKAVSALAEGKGGGMERLLLDGVVFGDVNRLLECSLAYCQIPKSSANSLASRDYQRKVRDAKTFLIEREFIESRCSSIACSDSSPTENNSTNSFSDADMELHSTALGQACCYSGLNPQVSVDELDTLRQARKRLLLVSEFHLVFLCTPVEHACEVKWGVFEKLVENLLREYPQIEPVIQYLGFNWKVLKKLVLNQKRQREDSFPFYKRLWGAMVLYSLVMERPLMNLSVEAELSRGVITAHEHRCAIHAAMIVTFCQRLNWRQLSEVLSPISRRLASGCTVPDHLRDLVRLGADMPVHRAKAFHHYGIQSLSTLASSTQMEVLRVLLNCMPFDGSDPMDANTASRKRSRREIQAGQVGWAEAGGGAEDESSHEAAESEIRLHDLAITLRRKALSIVASEVRGAQQRPAYTFHQDRR